MNTKDVMVLAGAALAVWALLKYAGDAKAAEPKYWVTSAGNTAFPDEMKTSGGGVWI